MRLTLLGTGLPMPNPKRKGPSQVISVGHLHILIDCGPGAVQRLGEAGIAPRDIDHVFITHHHADHYLDLDYFILIRWLTGCDRPLSIYGPSGQSRMIDRMMELNAYDFENRLHVMARGRPLPKIIVTEFGQGHIGDISGVGVSAFVTPHLPDDRSFGFCLRTRDKTIVISGDTAPCENVVKAAYKADILVHECVDSKKSNLASVPGFAPPEERLAYMASIHTVPEKLGLIAREAKPGKLVTMHMVPATVPAELKATIARDFDGTILIGEDLMQVD